MAGQRFAITEIFYSLQGEGFHTGTPAVFIRFSGCNLSCPFCDTDHRPQMMLTAEEILDRASQFPARIVILTGGEPTLQVTDDLVSLLHTSFPAIHIETNGTRPVPAAIDWVTVSPKEGGVKGNDRADELKVVYTGQDVEAIAREYPAPRLFLQPCSGENIPETIEYILSHPHWRLSLQTHKLVNIP